MSGHLTPAASAAGVPSGGHALAEIGRTLAFPHFREAEPPDGLRELREGPRIAPVRSPQGAERDDVVLRGSPGQQLEGFRWLPETDQRVGCDATRDPRSAREIPPDVGQRFLPSARVAEGAPGDRLQRAERKLTGKRRQSLGELN